KLMSVVALVIAPSLVSLSPADGVSMTKEDGTTITITEDGMKESRTIEKQIRIEMSNTAEGTYKAVVASSTEVDGELVEETKEFVADTKEEVEKLVEAYKNSAKAKN
ncbi:MAG: sodium-translocating pyrophosphatase, partial [Flavobacteriia bacterium]